MKPSKIVSLGFAGLIGISVSLMAENTVMPASTNSHSPPPPPSTSSGAQQGMERSWHPHMTPEQRQQKWQKRLEHWQSMTSEQKQQLATRMKQRWEALSPAEKHMVQEKLLFQWNAMSSDEQTNLLNKMMQSRYKDSNVTGR